MSPPASLSSNSAPIFCASRLAPLAALIAVSHIRLPTIKRQRRVTSPLPRTKMPTPALRSRRPSSTSALTALRAVMRLTPHSSAIATSVPKGSPGFIEATCSRSTSAMRALSDGRPLDFSFFAMTRTDYHKSAPPVNQKLYMYKNKSPPSPAYRRAELHASTLTPTIAANPT